MPSAASSIHAALVAAALLLPLTPAVAEADGERVLVGIEAAVFFPVTEPRVDRLYPGASFSVATQFSVTPYLMPLFRARSGFLLAQPQVDAGAEHVVSLLAGMRFRPRGIAHPEEPSRASCVWAEAAAGVAAWNAIGRPTFEGAVGFSFVVDDVTMGPVVRFAHVLPIELGDGPDLFAMTIGLEVLLNDAR